MGEPQEEGRAAGEDARPDRRSLLSRASTWFMLTGLAAGYGACGAMGARFLFPARGRELRWVFVGRRDAIAPGGALPFRAPSGERISITRAARTREGARPVDEFTAFSSVCPHLGCQVHWQPQKDRFFCPCHNGVFTPEGEPVSGPPADAGQALVSYPLKLEGELLYVRVAVEGLPRPKEQA